MMRNWNGNVAALPTDLKTKNYLAVLNIFKSGDRLSANEVSAKTGISRQTVMKAVNHFMEKGLIHPAGKGESTEIGGKKPELFQFDMKRYLLCIGVAGQEMTVRLYDLSSHLHGEEKTDFHTEDSVTDFFSKIKKISNRLLEEAEGKRELLYGVSLFLGGVIDGETGVLHYCALSPEWGRDVPLKEMLRECFPEAEIVVENVARMAACATVLDNPVYESGRVAVVYTDVGISACYIEKGNILHGANALIGEIGTMVLSLSEAGAYEKDARSFFSYQADETYLCGLARADKKQFEASRLCKYGEALTLGDLFCEADAEDVLAKQIVRKAAWSFGAAFYNVMLSFDPEVIILQGKYAHAGAWFEQCLKEALACFPGVEDEPFVLQYDKRPLIELQMMGATKLLTRRFFESPEWL